MTFDRKEADNQNHFGIRIPPKCSRMFDMERADWDTPEGPSKIIANPVPSNVFQKLCELIQELEAPPIQLKEFAAQLRIFSAASDTLDNYLENLEISPKDDTGTLEGILVGCKLCNQRCQILLVNFFVEFKIFAGRLESVINSQFYRSWEIDTVREIESMKTLTAAINTHLSPT